MCVYMPSIRVWRPTDGWFMCSLKDESRWTKSHHAKTRNTNTQNIPFIRIEWDGELEMNRDRERESFDKIEIGYDSRPIGGERILKGKNDGGTKIILKQTARAIQSTSTHEQRRNATHAERRNHRRKSYVSRVERVNNRFTPGKLCYILLSMTKPSNKRIDANEETNKIGCTNWKYTFRWMRIHHRWMINTRKFAILWTLPIKYLLSLFHCARSVYEITCVLNAFENGKTIF